MRFLAWFRKWFWCSWQHERCYPEVWGRGIRGPWHCVECHPCGEEVQRLWDRAHEHEAKMKVDFDNFRDRDLTDEEHEIVRETYEKNNPRGDAPKENIHGV